MNKKYYCKDCGKEISKRTVFYRKRSYCSSCARKGDRNHQFTGASVCPICGEWKNYKAQLCRNCYNKNRKIPLPKCIDCKKELSKIDCIRCHSCETKRRHKEHLMITKKINYKGIWMRSGWEVKYAKWCDKNKIKWLYEPKTFVVKDKLYIPDFYLSDKDLYIEIKGFWRNNAKTKFEMFKKLYPKIKIKLLYKTDLERLKILN